MNRAEFLTASLLSGTLLPSLAAPTANVPDNAPKPLKPFYLPPDPVPLQPGPDGINIRLKVRTRDTDNQFGSVEFAIAPRTIGPIPHVHDRLDEIMFVHEGEMHVMVGDEVTIVKAGGYHLRPHGIMHCFWNASDQPARFTDLFFNQNFDDFFEELFYKLMPRWKAEGIGRASAEAVRQRADLNKRFGLTQFPEKRQAIVDKYRLKNA
jgi:mannose-6-phosphate isomerase-like protein (cupin superfamily)